jgi:hypothetical protein
MNRLSFSTALLALGLFAVGCGDTGNGTDDGGHGLGDGHVQTSCSTDLDCDDGQACHMAHCNVVTHICEFTEKQCPAPDSCNTGMCDPTNGMCGAVAANEGMNCTDMQGNAGTCISGFCQAIPSCWNSMSSFNTLACTNDFQSSSSNINDTFLGSGVTNSITSYGSCATGETAPEVAYQFFNTATSDQIVTVHLDLDTSSLGGIDAGTADMATPDPDLDLIVIEGASCISTAACANPALAGGGFQGITAGTSRETVSFTAKAGAQYYIVVDGKGTGSFKLELEACGKCQPTPATTLSCNMSMSLGGNTAMGSNNLTSYTCTNANGTGTTMFNGPGKEQVFFYESQAPVVQKVQATVSGASTDVTLAAVPVGLTDDCNPATCVAGASSTGTAPSKTASITFNAAVNDAFSPNRYFVVVDSQAAASDTQYGLSFTCFPYCAQDSSLDCTMTKSGHGNNGSGQGHSVSAWGPAGAPCDGLSNLTGTEYVYLLSKPTTTATAIQITMVATTPGKQLALVVLDAGTNAGACDPTTTCATTMPVTVAASSGTLPSTGTYIAKGPSSATAMDEQTAVVKLTTPPTAHYYWVVVDGVNGDASDFAISLDSGCM